MLDIKKYSNGRFFDAVNRKFIKADSIKELIKKGEQIKVTLTTTGEEITESIISQYTEKLRGKVTDSIKLDSDDKTSSKATDSVKKSSADKDSKTAELWKIERFLNTDAMKSWVSDVIDRRINKVLEIMNLPTRDMIAELSANIQAINKKIDSLEASGPESVSESDGSQYKDSFSESDSIKFAEFEDNSEVFAQEPEISVYDSEVSTQDTEPVSDSLNTKRESFEEYVKKQAGEKNTYDRKIVKKRTRKKI